MLAGWAAIAIDNARRYRAEQSRRDALERAVRALEATTRDRPRDRRRDATRARARADREARPRARRGARAWCCCSRDGEELVVAAVAGDVDADLVGAARADRGLGDGRRAPHATRRAGRRREPARSPVRRSATRVDAATGAARARCSSTAAALGVFAAFDRLADGPGFAAEDERLLEAFAASAATAVATAQNVAS